MTLATVTDQPADALLSHHGLRPSWTRALWTCLLVAMVLAQTLGFTHTIVHALAPTPAHQADTTLASVEHIGEHTHGPEHDALHAPTQAGWLAQLFSAHGDASDCRLFDQFSHGDGLPGVPALCIPVLALPVFLQVFEASLPLASAVLVQARGPPRIR